ncbi:MAG TPA: alpha/beta-type small acid-soluble spore protein [Bacillales bacterium]|nr:alpha/beta-type small acid-soluble spore protein [Bacillales bacterium]
MSNNRRILVPEARDELDQLKQRVMAEQGYPVDQNNPQNAKYEVAKAEGVPLQKGYNGDITAKEAGKVGGNIGGNMVRELIQIAEQSLDQNKQQ